MYCYENERAQLFTDRGQREFLKVRDAAQRLLEKAGAFRQTEVIREAGISGDSWFMIACVDRLVELGEIREIPAEMPTQYRIYIKNC